MGTRHRSRTLASVACFLLLALGTSCSGVKRSQTVVDAGQDQALAWNAHREYLLEALESGRYEQPDFDKMINFFEDLTGVHSGLDASSLIGRIFSPKALRSALGKWDHWYRENADRIRWDADENRYVLRKIGPLEEKEGILVFGGESRTTDRRAVSYSIQDISVAMERTGCLRDRPEYLLTIDGNGTVVFVGKSGVRALGRHERKITTQEIVELLNEALRIHFFDLEDRYAGREYVLYEHGIFRLYVERVPDSPSTVLTVTLGGRRKTVINQYSGPPELAALADMIVEVAGIGEWIESD